MTVSESERLAALEALVPNMAKDIGEIKGQLTTLIQQRSDNHAKLESRLAVLEDRSSRIEKMAFGSMGVAGGAVVGHIPSIMQALGG